MEKDKGTLDIVLRRERPIAKYEPDYDYASDPTNLAFVAFLNPRHDAKEQMASFGEGEYVVYSGASTHDEKGTSEPKTLTKKEVTVGPKPEPKPAKVEGL